MTDCGDKVIQWLCEHDIEARESDGIERYDVLLGNGMRMTIDKDIYDPQARARLWLWVGELPFDEKAKARFARRLLSLNHTLLRDKSLALRWTHDESDIVLEPLEGALEKQGGRIGVFLSGLGKIGAYLRKQLQEASTTSPPRSIEARWLKTL